MPFIETLNKFVEKIQLNLILIYLLSFNSDTPKRLVLIDQLAEELFS